MIRPPKGCPDAVPTPQGWVHPTSGKVILTRRLANSDIVEYNRHVKNTTVAPKPAPVPAPAPEPIIEADPVLEEVEPEAEVLIEADPEEDDLSSMTKAELVEWGAEIGIELDMSMTKAEMLYELEG